MSTATLVRPPARRSPTGPLAHIPAFDGLRGLAILAVVAFHVAVMATRGASWATYDSPTVALWPLFAGKLGVDIFFVLSGFLVLRSWDETRRRHAGQLTSALSDFAERRARRILPAFWFSLLLLIPMRTPDWLGDIEGAKNILTFVSLQQFLDPQLPHQVNVVTWSLTTEVHFYVLLPVAALALARFGTTRMLVVLLAASVSWRLLNGGTGEEAEWILGRADQFAAGMAAASLVAGPDNPLRRFLLTRAGSWTLAIAAIVVALPLGALQLLPKPLLYSSTLHAAAGLVIAGWLVRIACRNTEGVLTGPVLRGLGHVSYGLFLWHWPLMMEATRRWGKGAPVLFGALAATAVMTAVSYVLVEKPFVQASRSAGTQRISAGRM